MAIISRRHFWNEEKFENVEILESGGITNNTLKVNYPLIPDLFDYSMFLDDVRKVMFSESKIEIVYDLEFNIGATSEGHQAFGAFRMINLDLESEVSPADYGFLIGLLTFSPGSFGWGMVRIKAGSPDFLGAGAANPSGPTRFRIRSDDDGSDVRLQVDIDAGSGFVEQYNDKFADMAPMIGELGDNGFFFSTGGAELPVIEVGDHSLLDNIQIDEQNVIPP